MHRVTQITFQMSELVRRLGLSHAQIEELHGITKEHVEQLVDDSWLQIRRTELQTLLALAADSQLGADSFISVQPHPAWETFASAQASVFRGCTVEGEAIDIDAELESSLRKRMKLKVQTNIYPHDGSLAAKLLDQVAEQMQTRNCIFIGGPKFNPFTETALALLTGTRPFDAKGEAPIRFYSDSISKMHGVSTFCGRAENLFGVEVTPTEGAQPVPLKTDRVKNTKLKGGWDIGLLAVCRRPLKAKADVTSIIIAGHQAPSTLGIFDNLYAGLPFLGKLNPGAPELRLFATPWKRRNNVVEPAGRGQRYERLEDVGRILRAINKGGLNGNDA